MPGHGGASGERPRVSQLRRASGMISVEWQQEENRGADRDWVDIYKFTLEPVSRSLSKCASTTRPHRVPSWCASPSACCGRQTQTLPILVGGRKPPNSQRAQVGSWKSRENSRMKRRLEFWQMFGIILKSPKDEAIMPPDVIYWSALHVRWMDIFWFITGCKKEKKRLVLKTHFMIQDYFLKSFYGGCLLDIYANNYRNKTTRKEVWQFALINCTF